VTDGDLFGEKTKIKMIFVDGKRLKIREPDRPKDPPKGDLTGKWTLKYTTPEGDEESTVELTCPRTDSFRDSSQPPRHRNIISGYASADKFNFVTNMVIEGSPADVNFSGTFEKNTMKGTIAVLSYSIDFTGTRPGAASVSMGGTQ